MTKAPWRCWTASGGLLAHELFSQVDLHRVFGGVVPELASRDHVRRLLPLVRSALDEAGTTPAELDGVAYTAGPGLIGALLTGAALARSLAYAWRKPAIGVHHLEGHLLAPLLEPEPPPFPHVALLVSGGHTHAHRGAGASGGTRCSAKHGTTPRARPSTRPPSCWGCRTPAGRSWRGSPRPARAGALRLPRPMLDRAGARVQLFRAEDRGAARRARSGRSRMQRKADIAYAVQDAIVERWWPRRCARWMTTGLDALVVSGGVGANRALRERMAAAAAGGARACTTPASSSVRTTPR